MLSLLFKHKKYPSYRVLQIYTLSTDNLTTISSRDINSVLPNVSDIVGYCVFSDIGNYWVSDALNNTISKMYGFDNFEVLDISDIPKSLNQELTKTQMDYYKDIITISSRPTKYFVNKLNDDLEDIHTFITIDFDIDMSDYIYNQPGHMNLDELDNLYEKLQTYQQILFIKYFTDVIFQEY